MGLNMKFTKYVLRFYSWQCNYRFNREVCWSCSSGCISRSSRAKRERERDRGRERERERERERQATPPAASCSGPQGNAFEILICRVAYHKADKVIKPIYLGSDTSVNGRVNIVGNTANLEHELANGYNSGDEYTGRTENNLTLAEWQEVSIIKYEYYIYDKFVTLCKTDCVLFSVN